MSLQCIHLYTGAKNGTTGLNITSEITADTLSEMFYMASAVGNQGQGVFTHFWYFDGYFYRQ